MFLRKILPIAQLALVASCKPEKRSGNQPPVADTTTTAAAPVAAPSFSADTAYMYVQKQVDFGPRIPNTIAHAKCADFLFKEFKKYASNVIMQQGEAITYDKTRLTLKNIIAEFNLEAKTRILLSCHWDTRPYADEDSKDKDKPFDGANDGGSSVGILLEIARQLQLKKPDVGVDIILFDGEDWGNSNVEDSYCLGSQYWGKNPHKPGCKATFGINLDMVGAANATFLREAISNRYAGWVVDKVWQKASQLGHSKYFLYQNYGGITDDHYYVNTLNGTPAIDIIHTKPSGGFGDFWHTHDDNMQVIDKNTLRAVGETLLAVIYAEKAS